MITRKKLLGGAAVALAAGALGLPGTAHAADTSAAATTTSCTQEATPPTLTTPGIAANVTAYGAGSVAAWNGDSSVILDPSSASGASAQVDLINPPAPDATIPPTMTASSASGGDPRWVIEFHNGNYLVGTLLTLPTETRQSALCWTLEPSGTPEPTWQAALAAAAPAGEDDQVTAAFIVDDAGYAGTQVTVSDISYNLKVVVPSTPPAYLYGGHVVSKSPTRVELGWKDGPGVHYVLAKTFGYKMSVNGSPHVGFTGGTTGYWSGLAPHHTYDIELIPANANRQELPNAQVGWINVVTP